MSVCPISFDYNNNIPFCSSQNGPIESRTKLKTVLSKADVVDDSIERYITKTNSLPAFNRTHFLYTDYQNLSPKEKLIISILNNKGENLSSNGTINLSINQYAERILNIAMKTKEKLDKEYPNGYKLVGVGNSPAPIVETMQLLGADAVTMPFSKKIFKNYKFPFKYSTADPYMGSSEFVVKDWINYFKTFSIDKNKFTKETGKTLIFTDFVYHEETKKYFESILCGLGFDENTKFIDILDLIPKNATLKGDIFDLGQSFVDGAFKRYSKMPSLYKIFENINIIKHPEFCATIPDNFFFKLFRCALYELINKSKIGRKSVCTKLV